MLNKNSNNNNINNKYFYSYNGSTSKYPNYNIIDYQKTNRNNENYGRVNQYL